MRPGEGEGEGNHEENDENEKEGENENEDENAKEDEVTKAGPEAALWFYREGFRMANFLWLPLCSNFLLFYFAELRFLVNVCRQIV